MDDSAKPDSDEHGKSSTHSKSSTSASLKVLLALVFAAGVIAALLLPARQSAREGARLNNCLGKMRQIGLALQNYAHQHDGMLPPAYTTDAEGKPLHSWRTLILPYMEETKLYDSIDLTKPWDDPANAEAAKTAIDAYTCPSFPGEEPLTTYMAVVAPHSCFLPTEPRRLSEITAKGSEVMMLIEVDEGHAVPWMKPVDADEEVVLELGNSARSKLYHTGGRFAAGFVDGSARFLDPQTPDSDLSAMMSSMGKDK